MIDRRVRQTLAPGLDRAAGRLARRGVRPVDLTGAGLVCGVLACGAGALGLWWWALALWLLNRALDGLDGPLARHLGTSSDLGGLLDFGADFVVYAGFVVAIAIDRPDARLACVALLGTYLVNNVILLSFAAIAERRRLEGGDERTLRLGSGFAEGTETIVVYCAFCLAPAAAEPLAWGWGALVAATAAQRLLEAIRALRPSADGVSARPPAEIPHRVPADTGRP